MTTPAPDPTTAAEYAAVLLAACRGRLGPDHALGESDGFFEAGMTSAMLASVVAGLEKSGVAVTLLDFLEFENVQRLAAELSARAGGESADADEHVLPWAL